MPEIYVRRALQNVGKKGLAVTIFVHGGGGTSGSGLRDFDTITNITRDSEMVAVSVSYALAP